MEFKDIIKNRRKELDLTLEEIGQAVGVAKATVQRWESGEIQNIRRDKISALAKILHLPVGVLMGWEDEETPKLKNPTVTTDTVVLPVIGNIAAGYDEIAIEDWSGETVEVPNSYLKGRNKKDFIVLKVHGDSMYPEYHNGDKVVILKQTSLSRSGAIGAVLYDGEAATLKKVEYYNNIIKLIPLNPTYPPKTITGADCECVHIIGIPKILIRDIEE